MELLVVRIDFQVHMMFLFNSFFNLFEKENVIYSTRQMIIHLDELIAELWKHLDIFLHEGNLRIESGLEGTRGSKG